MMLLCGSHIHAKLDHYVSFVFVTINVLKKIPYRRYDSVTRMLCELDLPSFDTGTYFLTNRGFNCST